MAAMATGILGSTLHFRYKHKGNAKNIHTFPYYWLLYYRFNTIKNRCAPRRL